MSLLVVSAGRGPVEVVRFVRMLAELIVLATGGERVAEGPGSVTLRVTDGRGWVGVHELRAALRGRGQRARWFAEVSEHEEPTERTFDARRVEIRAARAGGPGGQNVNKRSTAVRAFDPESGASVRAAGQRGQGQNRREALRRLGADVERANAEGRRVAEAERRAAHDRVRRGNPAFRWTLDAAGALRAQGDDRGYGALP